MPDEGGPLSDSTFGAAGRAGAEAWAKEEKKKKL